MIMKKQMVKTTSIPQAATCLSQILKLKPFNELMDVEDDTPEELSWPISCLIANICIADGTHESTVI
jgi:hypothetical protein